MSEPNNTPPASAPEPALDARFSETKPAQLPANTAIQTHKPALVRGLSVEDLITLNEEIAGMARAGLPLDQGLAALAKEMARGRLKRVTAAIAEDLKAGRTLPEALERQAGSVPPFYAGLVAAGVRSGRVGEVLATMTVYARTLGDLRATVISALVYPVMVMVLTLTLFTCVGYLLVPQFERIFEDFRMKLPTFTVIALAVMRNPLEVFVLPPLGIAVWLVAMKLTLSRTVWARFVYAIPLAGSLIRASRLAAFTELLAILVDHKVPLPEAFRLAGEASSDPLMAEGARQVVQDLSQGLPLSEIMRQRSMVPEVIAWMTGLGERRGNLGTTLHQVAELYRRQVEMRAALLRSVLPPVLILFTAGIMVGLFVLAVFLPLFQLLRGLGGL